MSKLIAKDKDIVVPGEQLAQGMEFVPGYGTYREGDNVRASLMGVLYVDNRALKIIPVSGKYMPKRDDVVIGQVIDIMMSGWRVEFDCAYSAMLNVRDASSDFIRKDADLREYFNIGDYIMTKITNVTSQKLVDITMKAPGLRRLSGGRIIKVNTNKVPRIIGKQGSMVSLVKDATGCRINVGQNGLVWISGDIEQEIIAMEAIKEIENNSHIPGLTDKIKAFLEKRTGKKIESKPKESVQNDN